MRLTKKVFTDLAIYMVALGVAIGLLFPFFSLLLGVPRDVIFKPLFFISCILAGILLGTINIILARKTVGSRISSLSHKMKYVSRILVDRNQGNESALCDYEDCLIKVDSEDELGESADSFNKLIVTLSEVLDTQTDIRQFSQMLSAHLDLEELTEQALIHLIKITGAGGGAILIEKSGELQVKAVMAIKDINLLENNSRVLGVMKTMERQLIQFPQDISLDCVIAGFMPRELLLEPIIYKNVLLGVLMLAGGASFTPKALEELSLCNPNLSMALNNAITHNQMQQLAALDPLTGLYNRRFGNKRIQEEFSRSIRAGTPLTLLMLDIDHFKNVNDTYGHMVGDRILVTISKTVLGAIREGDVLVRYGGEEFLCVLPGANQTDAAAVAERIRIMIKDTVVRHAEQEISVTVSIGAATYPHKDVLDIHQLIKITDEAMYAAKETGRDRVVSV
ncbi:MAG: GGDEF domain-containing protein [Clostridia bacterium]|nr:GGDEF domain-containing protein [Clostridia bacterium]